MRLCATVQVSRKGKKPFIKWSFSTSFVSTVSSSAPRNLNTYTKLSTDPPIAYAISPVSPVTPEKAMRTPKRNPKTSFTQKSRSEIYSLLWSPCREKAKEKRLRLSPMELNYYGGGRINTNKHHFSMAVFMGKGGDGGGKDADIRKGEGRIGWTYHYNLKVKQTMISVWVWLLAALLSVTSGKIIQVPPISSEDSLNLRLEQTASIDSAFALFGNLSHVYRREVQEVLQGKEVDFPPCSELPPETSFDGSALKHISDPTASFSKWLVYDFKQVLYPRRLIDISLYNSKLYYLLGDGRFMVNAISPDYATISDVSTHKLTESNVGKGNLVLLPKVNAGVFVNHNEAAVFSLSNDSFSLIQGFETHKDFQAAIPLDENYLAVAYGEEGLWIYSLSLGEGTLKKVYELNRLNSNISGLDIRDLAFDSTRKILFLVDYSSGLLSLQLSFSPSLTAKFTSSPKNLKQCSLIHYDKFADELYVNCRELHKFRISGWPIIDEKVLPRQEITVREITSTSRVVALVGRDIFQMLVADRKAAVYEDRLLDKLILTEDHFVSANEDSIMVGRFSVTPPSLRCSTHSPSLLGSHRLVLKMTAACNQDYFNKNGFQPGPLNADDKCIYTVYKNLVVWQPAVINTTPFMVIGVCLGLLGVGVLLWWGLSYVSLRRMRNNLENYQNLEEEGRGSEREREEKAEVELGRDSKAESETMGQAGTNEKFQKNAPVEPQEEGLHDIQ